MSQIKQPESQMQILTRELAKNVMRRVQSVFALSTAELKVDQSDQAHIDIAIHELNAARAQVDALVKESRRLEGEISKLMKG